MNTAQFMKTGLVSGAFGVRTPPEMNSRSIWEAAAGWFIGTMWPASKTLKNLRFFSVLRAPADLPSTYQSLYWALE
jgi:hypothetical protein